MYTCSRCGDRFSSFRTVGQCPFCHLPTAVQCQGCGFTGDASVFISKNDQCPQCGLPLDVMGRQKRKSTSGGIKKIAIIAVAFLLVLVLTKIANRQSADPMPGMDFWLKAQQVVQCSPTEITLVDEHHVATHLDKDQTWPDCSVFQKDEVLDFHLARSEKTLFLSYEKTAWWRKSM